MSNRLANETSPYLLQHENNPVDWYAWGPEALSRSKDEDTPIFLSIGYSACHWCPVLEHESFENEEIAKLLNENFVCIKVDREERPDLDQIYMNAVQLMTGQGGWPMSVFLTPQLQPFYGGTYWPPKAARGMPGFDQVIAAVCDAWQNRRDQALEQAGKITDYLAQMGVGETSSDELELDVLRLAEAKLEQVFDFTHGGFGRAPKFPHPMDLQVLLRIWHRWPRDGVLKMATLNLDKMAGGGIYDHLGGGFARYSVDDRWLVPHFEKMLYDNALLTGAYLDGFLATGNPNYARIAGETIDYILNYMTDENGAFHSTEDADSEGEEGKFYVWTPNEIQAVLGTETGTRFCYVYDVSADGNFEGTNILNLPKTIGQCASIRGWDAEELHQELAAARQKLLAVRDKRMRPGKDDKILVSWNGLMIDAMARADGILTVTRSESADSAIGKGTGKYLRAATRAAEFILAHMRCEDGRLLHSWRLGQAKFDGYLDDYVCLMNAFVTLYEASFDERWMDEAVRLADIVLARFHDSAAGGFFYTADDHEQLIARNKDMHDSSVPSGNAMAATALLRLGKLCGRGDYLHAAQGTLQMALDLMKQSPTGAGQMLIALDMHLGPMPEIVILGDASATGTGETLADLRRRYLPNRVLACRQEAESSGSAALDPLFHGKTKTYEEDPTVFICQDFVCQAPISGQDAANSAWDQLA